MLNVKNISNITAEKKVIDKIRASLIQKKKEDNDNEEIEFLLKRL
jgi:hypothetical protein